AGRVDAVQDGAVIARDVVDLHPLADLEIGEHPPVGGFELHPVRQLDDLELRVDEVDLGDLDTAGAGTGPISQGMRGRDEQTERHNRQKNLKTTHISLSSIGASAGPATRGSPDR